MGKLTNEAESNAIGVGMVIAAAIIADHNDVLAEEVLGAAGLETVAEMRAAGCDAYDVMRLRRVIRNIANRKAWLARKATTPARSEERRAGE